MRIIIENVRNYKQIKPSSGKYRLRKDGIAYVYCGRPSPLGNKFKISSEENRQLAIANFRRHLREEIKAYKYQDKESKLVEEILFLARMCVAEKFLDGTPVSEMILLCHCHPKPCHATVIANCIKWMIDESSFVYGAVEEIEEYTENKEYAEDEEDW